MTESDAIDRSTPSGGRLGSLATRARELVEQLEELSQQQSNAIETGDVEQISAFVVQREPVVASIVRVGEEIDAVINSIEEKSQHQSSLDQIREIELKMSKIQSQDREDQRAMQSLMDSIAGQLSNTGTNQNALRAYSSAPTQSSPILQDREV